MAEENIKEFTVGWVQFGLLFISLLTFAVVFMASNNPIGFGDSQNVFNNYSATLKNNVQLSQVNSNELLNITSKTNPTQSYLGSQDSVSAGFKFVSTPKSIFTESKMFFSWIFAGDIGKLLIEVFSALFGGLSAYYIYKWIRQAV